MRHLGQRENKRFGSRWRRRPFSLIDPRQPCRSQPCESSPHRFLDMVPKMGNHMGLSVGITMGNRTGLSMGVTMGNRMVHNMELSMGFRMGITMDKTMGIKMERHNFTLPAIDSSHARRATGPHQVPLNMLC